MLLRKNILRPKERPCNVLYEPAILVGAKYAGSYSFEISPEIGVRETILPANLATRFRISHCIHIGRVFIQFDPHNYPVVCDWWPPSGHRHKYIYVIRDIPGIPSLRSYIIGANVMLKRVSDGKILNTDSISIRTDWDSWCWAIDASLLDKDSLNAIIPSGDDYVEVEAEINSHKWRFLIEKWRRQRTFGTTVYRITGRSPSMILADPVAPRRNYLNEQDILARQLADEILENTGWAIGIWDTVDWLIKAKSFSLTNVTPMKAITTIANAVGAFVNTDMINKEIHVRKRYRHSPWLWNNETPDYEIPDSIIHELSNEYERRYPYNAVYVAGSDENGVLAKIYRSGTAGDVYPENLIQDSLITDSTAAQERGRIELSSAGTWEKISLAIPLMESSPGICLPGDFIQIVEEGTRIKSIVTGVQISATVDNTGKLSVIQVVDTERYYE